MTAGKSNWYACHYMKTFMESLRGLDTISVEIIVGNGTVNHHCKQSEIAKQIIDTFAISDPACTGPNGDACFTSFLCSGVQWYAGAGHSHGPVIAVESSYGACDGTAMIRPCMSSWGGHGKVAERPFCEGAESQTLTLNVYYGKFRKIRNKFFWP